jgi:ubiquinone/menaquinone biosynthesis C-methylase UbiE
MVELKKSVAQFWNTNPCGVHIASYPKYSKEYFEQIENYRYSLEPEIFSFAQFTRFYGKEVLEVGVGAGTDFLQWVRAGARVHGIDLTPEGIRHVKMRLDAYGLQATDLRVADAEALPYDNDMFDLVYSWGVIHHSPNTTKALDEIIRVTKPGGQCKIMVYNRHSLGAFHLWLRKAFLAGRPWKSFQWCIYHFQESPGTKAFTIKEFTTILKTRPVENVLIRPLMTYVDTKEKHPKKLVRVFGKIFSAIFPRNRVGWFLTIQFSKQNPKQPALLTR